MLYDLPEEAAEVFLLREDYPGGKGWRALKLYRAGHELGVAAHHLGLRLPKYELYETASQLRRAAKSFSANVVESYGRRRYKAEIIRFLIDARSSLSETEEHPQYVCDDHPDRTELDALLTMADELGRRLCRFLNSVEANHRT